MNTQRIVHSKRMREEIEEKVKERLNTPFLSRNGMTPEQINKALKEGKPAKPQNKRSKRRILGQKNKRLSKATRTRNLHQIDLASILKSDEYQEDYSIEYPIPDWFKREGKADGDIRRMKYSYKKAKEFFGFEPKYTAGEGVKRYVDWLQTV